MSCGRVPRLLTSRAGLPCSRLRQPALWQPASLPSRWETLPTSTGQHSISVMSSLRPFLFHRWPADCPCGPRREPWIFSGRGPFLPWTFAVCHGSPWSLASRHASHRDRGLAGKGATKKKILCGWALQGYLVVGRCRDAWWLGSVRNPCGWAVEGDFAVVGHCRDTWWLGSVRNPCGWALQGYSAVVGHCRDTWWLVTKVSFQSREDNIYFKFNNPTARVGKKKS